MHELSIASAIVSQVEAAARDNGADSVLSITVSVGRLSGVVPDALQFGFEIARQDTILADTELIIREVPVVVWCVDGDHLVELSEMVFRCPQHGCPTPDIRSGKEMQILEIEIPDDTP